MAIVMMIINDRYIENNSNINADTNNDDNIIFNDRNKFRLMINTIQWQL